MSIAIELTDTAQKLAFKLAERKGVSIEQAVEEAITESARRHGLLGSDRRTFGEIMGPDKYDEFGLPR